jgi:hypothetical protein
MDPLGLMPQGQQPTEQEPSLAGPQGTNPTGPQQQGGITEKQQFEELVMQAPIESLIKLVQSMSPEELGRKIQQLCIQQGMDKDEAVAFSITLMKVIFERIQNETGQAITEITGQTAGPAKEPSLAPNEMPMPPEAGGTA